MKKREYRATDITKVNVEQLSEKAQGKRVVFGVDIAKNNNYGCLMNEKQEALITIKWGHPKQSRQMVEMIRRLGALKVEVAMEPSGTYGDPVRELFTAAGIEVYRVSAKRSHDAAEVYDGVPSWHDAKSGAVIAKLHLDGASRLWPIEEEYRRNLAAVVNTMDMLQEQFQQNANRLEACMGRHWPEVGAILDLSSTTMLEVLSRFGSPREVVKHEGEARKLMKRIGGRFLAAEKVEEVIGSGQATIGMEMTAGEEQAVKYLAQRTRLLQRELGLTKKKVEKMSSGNKTVEAIGKVTGKATAAVLVKAGGDPLEYASGQQWLKSLGLNLKVRSSGKHQGKLKITKRGSGQARRWLYYVVLRLIQHDEVIKAWYARKIARDGGVKMKGLIAIMRKVVTGLWHVARGKEFDTKKLFDIRRLGEVF